MARRDGPDRDAFGRPVDPRSGERPRAAATPRAEPTPRPAPRTGPSSSAPGSGTWSAPERSGSSAPATPTAPGPTARGATSTGAVRNPDATAALLFGIASVVVLPFFLSIPAIVFARRARRTARDLPGRPGWAAATWGLWLGWITLLWPTLLIVLLVVGLSGSAVS